MVNELPIHSDNEIVVGGKEKRRSSSLSERNLA